MKIFSFATLLTLVTFGAVSAEAAQTAPAEPQNHSIDPWHINVPKPVANPVTSVTEKIPGSDLSAEIIYVEMNDGTYSPIAMMKPQGGGRFPLVVIAHMNGCGRTRWLQELRQ